MGQNVLINPQHGYVFINAYTNFLEQRGPFHDP